MTVYILILKGHCNHCQLIYKRIRTEQYLLIYFLYTYFYTDVILFPIRPGSFLRVLIFSNGCSEASPSTTFSCNLARVACADSFCYGRTVNAQNRRRVRI